MMIFKIRVKISPLANLDSYFLKCGLHNFSIFANFTPHSRTNASQALALYSEEVLSQ
jgi:hypothetical protein